ncbi:MULTISPECIES: hypothetical protein [Streptomyces]|uniref:Uncharacterized protein n=2 Tax=Streptomyces nigrescens TaxID=1920 RepID=A0A640TIZ2_STRNI|nr:MULTISPECIES: hypothetical protein [Streptomyces]MCX5444913.1 hypothetical protein [Streptomyces libani]WAT97036.1 hypothetical protein STRLI_002925 [Streptomyces libani subsp. libani]WAU04973.1 hypothetical protein STRNI_003295 [Streptomyces nigrescens]WDT57219.1 hypothetical protein NUT86_25975 [Streptomyces sp. G7(2002)]GFE22471.1 hypothetical protein Sliba_29240 [Streptomyces libani subsp. libani]
MKPDHVTPCRQFLHPGEVLWEARQYTEYPDLPLVPAQLRAPRQRSARKKGILGALGEVLDKASRPPSGTAGSRPGGRLLDNRLVNNPVTRAVGTVAETLNEARENIEDAVDDAANRALFGTTMEGDWASMAGRFLVQVTNAGGSPQHQALTDRRLFVLTDHASGWRERPPELEVAAQVQLSNIAELRPRPRAVFPRGRFDLVFVDGSWLALCCSFQEDMEAMVGAFRGR